jgi:hypothetical protein
VTLANSKKLEVSGYNWTIIAGTNQDALDSTTLSSRQLNLLREIELFDGNSSNTRLYDYFQNSGGLLNAYNNNPINDYNFAAIRLDLNEANKKLSEVKVQLIQANEKLFAHLAYEKQRDMQAMIDQLRQKLDDAKQKAQAAGLLEYLSAITAVAGDFGNIGTDIGQIYEGKDTPDTWKTLSKHLKDGGDSFSKLQALMQGANGAPVDELKRKLDDALSKYEEFVEIVKDQEQKFLAEQNSELFYGLDKRQTAFSRQALGSLQFHDLLRGTLTTYLIDPAKDVNYLRVNLEGLRTLLTDYPKQEPRFRLIATPRLCTGTSAVSISQEFWDCKAIEASTQWQMIEGTVQIGHGQANLPLYVLAPSSKRRAYPIFGLQTVPARFIQRSNVWSSRTLGRDFRTSP